MDLIELIARVEDAGITVSWTKLQRCNAGWDAGARTIWMKDGLYATPRRAKSILAHEWGHAILGHDGPQPDHEEARADMVAAGILIDPAAYARAERLHGTDAVAIALELDVSTRLALAYQGNLARAA